MTKKLIKMVGVFLFALLLASCNGSSGDNTPDDPLLIIAPITNITIAVLNGNCEAVTGNAFLLGDAICVQATLLQDGAAVAGEIITFSADIGSLSAITKLTDANGIAQVTLDSADSNIGAGALTASLGEESGSANYEFLASAIVAPLLPSISINLLDQNDIPITRFRADQEAQVQATLLNGSDEPIINQIIIFQSSAGTLSVSQALTNTQGVAQATLTVSDTQLGAATISANFSSDLDVPIASSLNFEVQSVDTVNDSVVRFGYFDGANFIENNIGFANAAATDDVTISSGASLGVLVGLADENDQPITISTPVTFTSRCVQSQTAIIDAQVNTINGVANATYQDTSCAGGAGNDDTIAATININSNSITISREVTLAPESVGAIEFISASPESIVLRGTGGQGSQSVSTVTFQVNGAQGNPLSQQTVNFSLNTTTGGLSLSPAAGTTNSQGQVSVKVSAGNVPTAVRVTAELALSDTQSIQTQSDLLSVNTGLPDQNSMTLSASNLNPEAFNIDNVDVTILASMADTFNNPVPDGTAIAFTTEGGRIGPSCTTFNGACSVIWTSSNPRVSDHRVTILATAIGHETLVDSNGNNQYDDADGTAITSNDGSGFDVTLPSTSGFVDLSEAWRDDNENRVRDANEIFLDFDSSGNFTPQNGLFDGPQCTGSSCGLTSTHVRKAQILITSSSAAFISVSNTDGEIANNQSVVIGAPEIKIEPGESAQFQYNYSDTAGQPIASGSNIQVSTSFGLASGNILATMPQTTQPGSRIGTFNITNNLTEPGPIDATVIVRITSPNGLVSQLNFLVSLE